MTGQKIQLLEGRYGLYLNDGVTNASLPKGSEPEGLTREQALELLAARAAMGPPKKGARRKTAAKSPRKKMAPVENGEAAKPIRKSAKKKSPARKKAAPKAG